MSTVEDIDFLAPVYDILKSIERESSESSAKRSEESSQKVTEFQKKLDLVREQIASLPGIEYSKEAQVRKFEALQKQLVLKKELLLKYKHMSSLEGVHQYLGTGT